MIVEQSRKIEVSLEFIVNGMIFSILNKFNVYCLSEKDIEDIQQKGIEDIIAFSKKDPCAKNDPKYIALCYKSYYAVLMYRVAHRIYHYGDIYDAKIISDHVKTITGIEIHPACIIGRRFVIDHGIGTVIGETVTIGDDCYILQNVILGSSKIAGNKQGVRHPQIGNNVEIGGFTSIFGNITIGDNVKISPRMVIRDSIPSDRRVVRLSNYNIVK